MFCCSSPVLHGRVALGETALRLLGTVDLGHIARAANRFA
jgi:hypothetical protein